MMYLVYFNALYFFIMEYHGKYYDELIATAVLYSFRKLL
jgi:hypothetical protein